MEQQRNSDLTKEQKEACVARLVERLKERPWEFGESGENVKEVIKEVTGVIVDDSQEPLMKEIFWAAVARLKRLDDLSSEERRIYDYYNEYIETYYKGSKKLPIEEAEKELGINFTTENRIRVTQKFLYRAIGIAILTSSEKKVWDFILSETQTSGKPPQLSDILKGTDASLHLMKFELR